jgi:hypothetical protein
VQKSVYLKKAVGINFHRKDAKTLRKNKSLNKMRMICVITKRVNLDFAVSPLRSWRLCGKFFSTAFLGVFQCFIAAAVRLRG